MLLSYFKTCFPPENITTGAPVLGTPSSTSNFELEAEDIEAVLLFWKMRTFQHHSLTSENIETLAPEVNETSILQRHYLIADILLLGLQF